MVIDLESMERAIDAQLKQARERKHDAQRIGDRDETSYYDGRETGLDIAKAMIQQLKVAGKVE